MRGLQKSIFVATPPSIANFPATSPHAIDLLTTSYQMHLSHLIHSLLVILIHLIFTCVAGGIALFDCSAYGYCADKMTSSTGAVYYRFGLAEPTQDVNSWTCSYSQLAGKHIVNVCCNNPVGLTKVRKSFSIVVVIVLGNSSA
ncbi:hypothetical protein MJO28_017813 [Puccinia striiformis f. sp. tritici]|nr:hypothetical protein MJO28_017813 [Puccinia striiformis f. sp. tritici]